MGNVIAAYIMLTGKLLIKYYMYVPHTKCRTLTPETGLDNKSTLVKVSERSQFQSHVKNN